MSMKRPNLWWAVPAMAVLSQLAACGSDIAIRRQTQSTTSAATTVYVTQLPPGATTGSGSVLEFTALSSGVVQPNLAVNAPSNLIVLEGMTVDSTTGSLYVGGFTITATTKSSLVDQLAPNANGASTPAKTFQLSGGNPGEMAFDAQGNLYTGSDAEIDVFSLSAGTQPIRVITGPATQLTEVNGIAVDTQGEIFVTNGLSGVGSVLVFAPGATGNVAPVRTINGVGTANFYSPSGIAIDDAGNLFVASYLAPTASPAQPSSIFEVAPGASGFAVPLNTIAGSATGLYGVGGMQFDRAGNLYVVVIAPSLQPSVSVFGPGATGNAAPLRSFTSPVWTGAGYGQIGLF